MLQLKRSAFIGKGLHRECFVHPEDKNLCIKVVVRGDQSESEREESYYRHLQQRQIIWQSLPKFHGHVETSMGRGAIFDLVRDDGGAISRTLEYYLSSANEEALDEGCLKAALDFLWDDLYQQKILTITIKPKNVLYQMLNENKGRLIIVDNIGNSDSIPICNYIGFLAREKTKRKWQRFLSELKKDYGDNAVLQSILSV